MDCAALCFPECWAALLACLLAAESAASVHPFLLLQLVFSVLIDLIDWSSDSFVRCLPVLFVCLEWFSCLTNLLTTFSLSVSGTDLRMETNYESITLSSMKTELTTLPSCPPFPPACPSPTRVAARSVGAMETRTGGWIIQRPLPPPLHPSLPFSNIAPSPYPQAPRLSTSYPTVNLSLSFFSHHLLSLLPSPPLSLQSSHCADSGKSQGGKESCRWRVINPGWMAP